MNTHDFLSNNRQSSPRTALIIGGAILFGAAPACLEPGTSGGADAIADAPADISVDSAGEVWADAQLDASSDTVGCWTAPSDLETLVGQSCPQDWSQRGVCADSQLAVKCDGAVWSRATSPEDDFCWCNGPIECEPEEYVCGAVGFVGIARAGSPRKGGWSVRVV